MTEASKHSASKRKIMVVDDESMVAITLTTILNNAGFEACAVFSGEEAVQLLDTFQPEMLIIDVVMSGMNGIQLGILIRRKLPDCKILLFSGQAATVDLLEEARTQGHEFEVVTKPIHPSDLLAKLGVRPVQRSESA